MSTMLEDQVVDLKEEKKKIKCLVWDLDNTLWKGVLLEDTEVVLRDGVREAIEQLDRNGILMSIASKNDYDTAMRQLSEFGLAEYFLFPEISWNAKSHSIRKIADSLNIGLDTIAFIDDQEFEREEVAFAIPEVKCIDAVAITSIVDMPEMRPRFLTSESSLRRQMYMSEILRKKVEEEFVDTDESFLETLEMVFSIKPASEEDLQRAEELTVRTNQLNTTGYTYGYEELNEFRCSNGYHLLVSSLEDKYGPYGAIGLALVEKSPGLWTLKLLLMSCRVMSRGVGTIVLSHIMSQAKAAGARLQAEFLPNDRNKMMYITFKFGGFRKVDQRGDVLVLEHDLERIQPFPDYVKVNILE